MSAEYYETLFDGRDALDVGERPIRVLLIEDNPADALMVKQYIEEVDWAPIWIDDTEKLDDGLARLKEEAFDEVLLDLNLPDSTGLETFLKIHQKFRELPIIVLTGLELDDLGWEAVRAGAQDYLSKSRLEPQLLVRTILYAYERSQHRRAEQRFRDMVETARDWIWETDVHGLFTYSSPKVKDLLGYEPTEILGCSPCDFMTRQESVRWAALFRDILRGRRSFDRLEKTNVHKDGRLVVLETSGVPILDDEGGFHGYRGIDRDITESKKAEKALRHSEQRYRQLLAAVTSYTYTVHLNDGVPVGTDHSAGCETTTGYRPEEFEADPYLWINMVHPDDRLMVQQHVARVSAQQDVAPIEHRILRRDGQPRWVRNTIVYRRDENGRIRCYDGLIEDITERKEAESALREREVHLLAAQKIQERLLPTRSPVIPGFDIAGATFPAEFTAGDYFDYLPMRDGSVGLVVVDVSGHGFGPALLMASLRAHLRSVANTSNDLAEILGRANAVLYQETEEGRFATLILARLDPRTRSLTYANAGHPEGIILDRRGNIKSRMASTQIPLAILPGTEYDVSEAIPLLPGDIILLRSDGLQETLDREGKYYGAKRILREVRANSTRTAREIVNHLYACAKSHGSPNKLVDDITLLAVKVTA